MTIALQSSRHELGQFRHSSEQGENGRPREVAGVPPDYFSKTGQFWGNPLYRWDRMEEDGFAWWIERIRANLRLADLIRIDHFRAFAAYWAVPAREKTAAGGRWVPGPGPKVFHALEQALGRLPIIAEDLGHITEDVRELRSELGFPGMRVLHFAFDDPDSDHLRSSSTPAPCGTGAGSWRGSRGCGSGSTAALAPGIGGLAAEGGSARKSSRRCCWTLLGQYIKIRPEQQWVRLRWWS